MGQLISDVESVLKYKSDKKEAVNARQKILEQIDRDEKSKINLVKKALAKQRATYGAGGMTGRGMTEEAVLKRIREESEEPFVSKKFTHLEKISQIKRPQRGGLLKSLISQFESLIS